MERKRIFRRATKQKSQLKRSEAVEFAQEFPEGPLGAPPHESDPQMMEPNKMDRKKE